VYYILFTFQPHYQNQIHPNKTTKNTTLKKNTKKLQHSKKHKLQPISTMSTTTKIIQTGTPTTRKGMPKRKDVRKFSRKWEGKKSGFKLQREQKIRQQRDTKQSNTFENPVMVPEPTFEELCSRVSHCECGNIFRSSKTRKAWQRGEWVGSCQDKVNVSIWGVTEYEERCEYLEMYMWQDKPVHSFRPAKILYPAWSQDTNSYSYADAVSYSI
jgi:hypothetical protein